jgi:hypothetical protein
LSSVLAIFVGDERKIKQILLNLLSNAVKLTPEGGRIGINARQADGFVEISVSDTGIGISPEDQAKIFEEFRQVGGDYSHKKEGTGLGLTLAKKFVELHGGEDLGGKRDRQRLYLQVYLAREIIDAKLILIVEDNDQNRQLGRFEYLSGWIGTSDIRSAVHSQFDVRSTYVSQPPPLVFSVLLDHLICSCQQIRWNRQTDLLRCL